MSQAKATRDTIRLFQRGAAAGFNSGTDLRHESTFAGIVGVTLLSLLAVAAPATACEQSIDKSNISTSDTASLQRKGCQPADAAITPANGGDEVTASAFDPVTLPPIESIGPQTDITVFLQSGVPAELQLAALRRAWTVDPAIRDFKGLEENDWNFGDSNSIAGFGELGPEVDVKIWVARILGEPPRVAARPPKKLEEPRTFASLVNVVWASLAPRRHD